MSTRISMIDIIVKVCWPRRNVLVYRRPTPKCTEALQAKIGTLSLEKQAKLEQDAAKKEKKAEAKAGAAEKKKKVRSPLDLLLCDTNQKHIGVARTFLFPVLTLFFCLSK